jgi:hypothetical protein
LSLEFTEYPEIDLILNALASLQSLPNRVGPDENTSGPMWSSFEGENKHNFLAFFTFKRLHIRLRSDNFSLVELSSFLLEL